MCWPVVDSRTSDKNRPGLAFKESPFVATRTAHQHIRLMFTDLQPLLTNNFMNDGYAGKRSV
jgi:hypothetical protein